LSEGRFPGIHENAAHGRGVLRSGVQLIEQHPPA
jgi:hypothetical protein